MLAALFAAGILLAAAVAAGGRAADTTTTATTTELTTTTETTTEPATTVVTTTTVQETTTHEITAPPPTTTATAETKQTDVPGWAWATIGILGVAIVVLALLLTRRRGPATISPEERRSRLADAARGWVTQGWAIDGQTSDSTVLSRGNELMIVTVDDAGHVSTRSLTTGGGSV